MFHSRARVLAGLARSVVFSRCFHRDETHRLQVCRLTSPPLGALPGQEGRDVDRYRTGKSRYGFPFEEIDSAISFYKPWALVKMARPHTGSSRCEAQPEPRTASVG